jgi:uncharacterized protein (TIGR02598 family)
MKARLRLPSAPGLSLVELAMALGIMAFVLVAVFGLTMNSLRQLQSSEADSRVPVVTQRALALARFELGRDAEFRNPTGSWQGGERRLFFDKEGGLLESSNDSRAYFDTRLRLSALPTNASGSLTNVPADSLKNLEVTVSWPMPATNPANTWQLHLLLWNSGRL